MTSNTINPNIAAGQAAVKQQSIWSYIRNAPDRYQNPSVAQFKGQKGPEVKHEIKATRLVTSLKHDEYLPQKSFWGSLLTTPFGGTAFENAKAFIASKHPDHSEGFNKADNKADYLQEHLSTQQRAEIYDHVAGSRLGAKIGFVAALFNSVPILLQSGGPAEFTSNLLNMLFNSFGITRLSNVISAMLPTGAGPLFDVAFNMFGWNLINQAYDATLGKVARGWDQNLGFVKQQPEASSGMPASFSQQSFSAFA
jgi:hypothetical protein